MRVAVFALSVLIVLIMVRFPPSSSAQAPPIEIIQTNGERLQLDALRGNPALVHFWSTTCIPCLRELDELALLYRDLSPQGLQMVGIAMHYDPPSRVVAVTQNFGVPYAVALDPTAQAQRAFGNVNVTPTHFLIDPQGTILQKTVGPLDVEATRQRVIALLADPAREGTR